MVSEDAIWERLHELDNKIVVLQTKMQGIWWVMNIVGGAILVFVIKQILKD